MPKSWPCDPDRQHGPDGLRDLASREPPQRVGHQLDDVVERQQTGDVGFAQKPEEDARDAGPAPVGGFVDVVRCRLALGLLRSQEVRAAGHALIADHGVGAFHEIGVCRWFPAAERTPQVVEVVRVGSANLSKAHEHHLTISVSTR